LKFENFSGNFQDHRFDFDSTGVRQVFDCQRSLRS